MDVSILINLIALMFVPKTGVLDSEFDTSIFFISQPFVFLGEFATLFQV